MSGTFYIVGVGPGDPELMTLKAARILRQCEVLCVPKGHQDGHSTALGIVAGSVELAGKTVRELHFPMKKIRMHEAPDPEVAAAWQAAAKEVIAHLDQGKDVGFPTLGDPAIYSTGFYLYHTILETRPELAVQIVAGVSSISACAAATGAPLCLGDDLLAVVPATFDDHRVREALLTFNTVVLMKVHQVMGRLVELLAELDLLNHAVLVERSAQNDQRVIRDLRSVLGRELHYFSTIIVRKG